MNEELLAQAKSLGFSDRQIAHLSGRTEDDIRALRKKLGLVPSYRLVDTCAAWFEAYTRRTIRPATALHPAELNPSLWSRTRHKLLSWPQNRISTATFARALR